MREAVAFYWRWFVKTVWRAPGAADGYAGLVGTIIGLAQHYRPELQRMTQDWIWQVPLWAFGAVLVVRFFAAPFEIWKEERRRAGPIENAEELKARRRDLGRLLSQCEHIKKQCGLSEPVNEPMVEEWFGRTQKFLVEELGEEYLHRFLSDAGLAPLVLTEPSIPERNKELWAYLYKRATRLNSFLETMA